ncbi:MAG: glycosyltransferase family 4 protein [Saprospiraceae bacterium]|nr:glycosyltransferase family 4 protein [Saprospiraceae bacterium]MDW8483197.1 glycosyltransferase family 4 protein [Saprospiraceae bacterium]
MHIVLLSARVPPCLDGVGDYSARLAEALMRKGVKVTLAFGTQRVWEVPVGVSVWPKAWTGGLFNAAHWRRGLQTLQPDALVLQYVPHAFQQQGLPFFLPNLLRQARRLGICTGVVFHEVHVRLREHLLYGLGQRWIARHIGKQANVRITSIPFYQQMLAAIGLDAHVLPVGANIDVHPPSPMEIALLRRHYFPGKTFIVSTFGRRDVRALAAAVRQMPEAGLLVVGPSPWAKAPPYAHATGYLPASDVCRWLRCGDVFALPDPKAPDGTGGTSLKSGSLAAAFAAGLPVVGVEGDMIAPPLAHGENIWLVQQNTPRHWAEALLHLRQQPDLRQTLARGGHELYRQHLDWDVLATKLQHLLEAAAKG